jgi:beta-mannosidase
MIRAWGSGMPETDDFYDLCDRKGIMIFQEWPTAWNSHQKQPYGLLEETVHQNTLRIRNHPSLALLSGGNESDRPFGPAIDMMGRAAVELDGTRAFHRGEAWGGSLHNYDAYWGQQHPDHNLTMTSHFWGEFGVACMPVFESVMKYLPESERNVWPLSDNSVFAHHTPTFNADSDMVLLFGAKKDMALQKKYAGYFTSGATMQRFIMASQMSQAVGLRHTLERSRTRWPECTGSLYYKMNDNYPAASWSTADWYGAPKMGHYFCQDAYSPLHACVLFEKLDNTGERVAWPVFVLDDTDELRDSSWQVNVRAFDGRLKQITASEISGKGSIENVKKVGDFSLNAAQTNTNPLLIVVDMIKEGKIAGRTFYWLNYEPVKDCLFELPRTALRLVNDGKSLMVTNTGNVPAVAVYFTSPEHSESFAASDGYFWLDPSESKTVTATRYEGITASALNADSV